jgi:hypothetical protein
VRVVAAILAVLITLGGCRSAPERAAGTVEPAPAGPGEMSCTAWPNGVLPSDSGLLRSPDQDIPGTERDVASPVTVTVGLACVMLPPRSAISGVYCGAAEHGRAPRPCQVGEECAIGSIMVTDVSVSREADGLAACATFENWSKSSSRDISLWVRTR